MDFEKKTGEIFHLQEEKLQPLSKEEQNALYTAAFSLYNEGNYETAVHLFTKLVLAAPFNPHCWRGLASSQQMQRAYNAALHAWCMVALLNDQDPLPHFHAGECYLSLQQKGEAEKAFKAAEKLLDVATEEGRKLAEKIQNFKNVYGGTHVSH